MYYIYIPKNHAVPLGLPPFTSLCWAIHPHSCPCFKTLRLFPLLLTVIVYFIPPLDNAGCCAGQTLGLGLAVLPMDTLLFLLADTLHIWINWDFPMQSYFNSTIQIHKIEKNHDI